MRTAKPCGPGAPTLASSFAEFFCEATVARKPGHRGEHGAAVKTIAQGRLGEPGVPVVTMLVCFFISHARLGVRRAPGFACALFYQRDKVSASLGPEWRRETAGARPKCDEGIGCLKSAVAQPFSTRNSTRSAAKRERFVTSGLPSVSKSVASTTRTGRPSARSSRDASVASTMAAAIRVEPRR
jgi:hypothetical protein